MNTHKFKALVGRAVIGGKSCLVMKPETFMNNSGEAVSDAMDFYDIPLENVVVVYDDISLDVGKMRIRRNTCEAVELMVQGKINEAMNKFN